MAEKLPYPVFDRPLTTPPLSEAPRALNGRIFNRKPNHQQASDAYNRGLRRLLERGAELEQRLQDGEFNSLGSISAKIEAGGTPAAYERTLMRDFGTLMDSRDAKDGRAVLNKTRFVFHVNDMESNRKAIPPQYREIRNQYEAGDFQLIAGGNYPLDRNSTIDRFVVPMAEDKDFAIFDGAPVEGIIRDTDRRIAELETRRDGNWFTRCFRQRELRGLRLDRDRLYTSSTPIFERDNKITHARKQYEALLKSQDPLLSEWEKPDWYKIELALRDRRVLDLERGGMRWGCLPLLLPLIIAVPLFSLCGRQPEQVPVLPPVVVTDACYGVLDGKLRTEAFKDSQPSFKGHIEREIAYVEWGLDQQEYRPNDDTNLIEQVEKIKFETPDLFDTYLRIAEKDSTQTGQRITSQLRNNLPFVSATDFKDDSALLFSCLTPVQRFEMAKLAVNATKSQ